MSASRPLPACIHTSPSFLAPRPVVELSSSAGHPHSHPSPPGDASDCPQAPIVHARTTASPDPANGPHLTSRAIDNTRPHGLRHGLPNLARPPWLNHFHATETTLVCPRPFVSCIPRQRVQYSPAVRHSTRIRFHGGGKKETGSTRQSGSPCWGPTMKAAPLAIALHDIEHQSGVLQLTIRGPTLLIDRRGRTAALAMADGPPCPPLPGPAIAAGTTRGTRGRAKSGTGQEDGTVDKRAEDSASAKSAESP